MTGEELLAALIAGGFTALVDDQSSDLAEYLDRLGSETGYATPVFIAEALRAVDAFRQEHDGAGGIRAGFLKRLDVLAQEGLPPIQSGDPAREAPRAKRFRDEVIQRVSDYNPGDPASNSS